MMLLGSGNGVLIGFPVVEINAGILLDGFHHRQTLPVAHINLLALISDLQTAANLERQALVHFLDQIHHAVKVGERLIQLDGRELRVVLGIHTLVAEDTADLVHAVHAAHDQALKVQLGLNAQDHVHVQGVVVGVEGAGRGTNLERSQNGGVNLQKALLIQIRADLLHDLTALDEGVLDLGVNDQVNIALAVARLTVGQTVELLGQGQQALGEQCQLGDAHRNLAHLGAENLALDADDVTDVELFEGGVGFLAQQVALDKDLDVTLLVAQMGKAGLAHNALGHHTAGQRDDLTGLSLGRQLGKFLFEVGRVRVLRIFGDFKGVVTGFAQVRQLLAAHSGLLGEFLLGLGLILLHERSSFRDYLFY